MEERYILIEAAGILDISKRALDQWIDRAGMRSVVNKQRMETDMRARYLTRSQLEQLAALHRRTLRGDGEIGEVRQRLAAVEERLARLEALITHQGGISEVGS